MEKGKKKEFKGKKYIPKGKGKDEFDNPKLSGCNDWSWYAQSEQLLRDTASLAYSQMLGMKLDTQGISVFRESQEDDSPVLPNIIPGVMVIDLEPTLGCGSQETDAPTVSARATYSFVRHANSGSANYEAPDLMMYLSAYVSAASLLEDAKRAYSIMRTYALKNRYFAKTLTTAAGYDYDDFITKLADFRAYINISCARLNSLKVPTTSSYILRQLWISANYYMDEDSTKGQIYLMRFKRFMRLEATRWETGTGISFIERPETFTLDSFKSYLDDILERIIANEDFNIMSGDILKAFGSNVFTLTTIPEDYQVLPSSLEPVKHQIHNLTQFPVDQFTSNLSSSGANLNCNFIHTIKQDTRGAIVEEFSIVNNREDATEIPILEDLKYILDGNLIWLDMHMDAPEPKDTIVATRLTNKIRSQYTGAPVGTLINTGSRVMYLEHTGTEVVTGIKIYGNPNKEGAMIFYTVQDANAMKPVGTCAVSSFDYHPLMYLYHTVVNSDNPNGVTEFYGVLGEIDNVVPLSEATLKNMNKMAVLSELDFVNNLSPEKGGFMK